MKRTVSATEARIHFGELMRKVVERDETVIVERSGKPQVVVLSFEEYQRRVGGQDREPQPNWEERFRRARALLDKELSGRDLPDIDEIFHEMREERDAQLLNGLR
ncbi:MAG TPA: type II toxin-antitoxin system Phd/YefM family antitoxin [Thermomicrobiales bacterium]|jgi:prevent-host-death family protein|nr:type II toxin-antitoxin system Phd/YefM family antitoxin [Thermomicrobiales bacterium]